MKKASESLSALEILTSKVISWTNSAIALLPNLLVATIAMLAFWMLARVSANVIRRLLSHTSESATVTNLIVSFSRMAILFFGLFTTLGILNLDKTVASLLAGAGVIGLAVGFAFQEIAANFFSGVLIALRKPYRENDLVQVDSHIGVVSAITLRTTNLQSFGGLEILIPNKDMFTKPVINYTRTLERRVDITVGISYGENLREVEQVVRDAVKDIAGRLPERETEFFYLSFGESSIDFQVRFRIEFKKQTDYLAAIHAAIIAIKESFDAKNIMIPFPIRTLDFNIKGGRSLSESLSINSTKELQS